MNLRVTYLIGVLATLAGCAEEIPPPSVQELVDDPIVLEATVVRCSANRSESRYKKECINARQAVAIVEAREDRTRREAFEAQSAAKRAALRRTQEAAAEARRRAEEAERQRKEAEYLAQFGEVLPPDGATEGEDDATFNAPTAVIPTPAETPPTHALPAGSEPASTAGSNAPVIQAEPPVNLNDIREELRRRSGETEN
jgi:hypothetical protein